MSIDEVQVRAIFLGALDCEPGQWSDYLSQACGQDPDLRAKVDGLLLAHRAMGSIRDHDHRTPPYWEAGHSPDGPGMVIGPYRLLEKIGEGGFGIVYMAEQVQPMRRKVALKIIKPGMDTRRVVARFEAERQALALMDHPNIAQVFDGGATSTGRPYFVMELVRGVPITEFCDENRLSVRDRIELFVMVCQAVQHAHQKGIIHRDLKPTNVMVTMHDDAQVVKVIDFGIAKAVGQQLTEKTLFTNFAQMIGTPPYMSPEQAQMSGLDVDTRCDIYAMGVLLYELLTGTTPFDQERLRTVTFDEIRRIIREEEPPKPSTRLSSATAAIATASAKRGSDPRRLIQLVRGELDWIVMKCLEKNRNRRYETANGLGVDLLRYLRNEPVHACPPSPAYRLQVFTRRHRASIGTAGLILAIALVGGALTLWQAIRAASARDAAVRARLALSATRQHAAEERANAIARDLETLNKANSLIESGRSHADFSEWDKAEADLRLASTLRPDHSSVWLTRGDVYARLNLWDLAAADFQKAFGLREPGSVNALYLHALLRLYVGDKAGYRESCDRMAKRFHDRDDPRAWEKEEIAHACLLGEETTLGPDRLVQLTQRAVESGRTAVRLASLGTAFYRAGQYETALERLQEAKAASPRWETSWTDSVSAMIHHRMGRSELARKALDAAGDSLGRRLRLRYDNVGSSPNAQWWYELHGDLYFREAKRLVEGMEPKDDARQLCNRGDSLAALGRNGEAIATLGQAIKLNTGFARALDRRAEIYARVGDWRNSLKDYERLRALQPGDAGLNNELAWRLCTCPDLKYRDTKRAIELAQKAVALAPSEGNNWNTLGVVRYRAGDWPGSARAVLKSMELTNARDVRDWLVLAMCEWRIGQESKAQQLFHHALRRIEAGGNQTEYLTEFRDEAAALLGQPEAARPVPAAGPQEDPSAFVLLLEIDPGATWAYGLRGVACARLKQWDQAAADLTRATEARPENADLWYQLAAARLGAGDMDGYRAVRAEILTHFRDTKRPPVASHVSYISVVAPTTSDEAEALLRLANFAVGATPGNPRIRGAANYRAGNYKATIVDLDQSAKVFTRRAWDWLFLAMAHHKLGHTEESKKCLQKAVQWVEQSDRTQAMGLTNPWFGWYEPVEVERLLREAKGLID